MSNRAGPSGSKSTLDNKIAKKEAALQRLEERLQYMMSQRATLEMELGDLLRKRAAVRVLVRDACAVCEKTNCDGCP